MNWTVLINQFHCAYLTRKIKRYYPGIKFYPIEDRLKPKNGKMTRINATLVKSIF